MTHVVATSVPHPVSRAWYWAVLVGTLVLDQCSKWLVMQHLALYESVSVLGEFLRLTYVRNAGAAFSLLAHPAAASWRLYLLAAIAVITVVVLTVIVYRERDAGLKQLIPFGLISGGALGNLADRLTAGTVTDFIEFSYKTFHFAVFNLADSSVFIGVCWILLTTFFTSGETNQ